MLSPDWLSYFPLSVDFATGIWLILSHNAARAPRCIGASSWVFISAPLSYNPMQSFRQVDYLPQTLI